jgi:hypothetical protein
MKTVSNTAPRHVITCGVHFNGALVNQHYIQANSSPSVLTLAQWKWYIEAVCFKTQYVNQRNLHVCGITAKPFSCFCHIY